MKTENHQASFKEKIVEICNIPQEILLGYAVLTAVGKKELRIENHRGILEYDNETIRIMTKIGQIKIDGKGLNIRNYTNDEININGNISRIEFL